VLLIKRNQEIRIPYFVAYPSVPTPPFKNGLYKSVCVKERDRKRDRGKKRNNKRERVRQRERGRTRERKSNVGVHNHPPCPCPSHYLRHRRHLVIQHTWLIGHICSAAYIFLNNTCMFLNFTDICISCILEQHACDPYVTYSRILLHPFGEL